MEKLTFKAFTLIELLVVIAIIALLSSIIIASLDSARLKASDSAVKSEVLQLRTIMNQEYTDTGTYTAIKAGGNWKKQGDTCSGFTGTYASQAATVCNQLVSASCSSYTGGNCVYFAGTNPTSVTEFSIMAYLPGVSKDTGTTQYLCVGSSGRTSIGPATPPGGGSWTGPGCYANP